MFYREAHRKIFEAAVDLNQRNEPIDLVTLTEALRITETPITGGNVSLYNETSGVGIWPTPTVGVVGRVEADIRVLPAAGCTRPGLEILLLGTLGDTVAGSALQELVLGTLCGRVPAPDWTLLGNLTTYVREQVANGTFVAAHDVAEGGLILAVAEMALAGGHGCTLDGSVAPLAAWFSETGQAMLNSMRKRGLQGLSFWHNGMKQFGGPVSLRTPEAAKGLKFRIMESDVLQAQIMQIGGNPQKMAFGEVYQALQTGAVDAQENTWSNIYSSKFYEVQAYVTETNHGYLGYLVAVNPDFWNSLPEDIRVELSAIVQEVSTWANERSAGINLDAKEKIIASGRSEVIELTPEERAVWQRAMRPVWEKFSDVIGADAIAAAEAIGQSAE